MLINTLIGPKQKEKKRKKNTSDEHHRLYWAALIGENRQLGTTEPVEFEKLPVEVHQDCRKITDHSRGIYRIYPI